MNDQIRLFCRRAAVFFMDFSKLIRDDFTADWVKNIIRELSPYPYLADILIILSSFAGGALRFDRLKNPVCPDNGDSPGEQML